MLNFRSVNIAAGVILLILIGFYLFSNITIWWVFILCAIWLLVTMLGSGLIHWNYHLKALNYKANIKTNHVAITFDDGPNPNFTPKVLELLEKYHAKATFFCIGKHVESHPDIFKTIIEQGHTVGNHTYSHTNTFGFLGTEKVISELQKTNNIVKNISGLHLNLYRPAFGVTNPRIKQAVKKLNLITIGWNKRSLDTTKLNEKQILKRITTNLKKGDVILLHDTSEKTIRVLERLLLFLQEKNLQSVTVNDLFNVKAYV